MNIESAFRFFLTHLAEGGHPCQVADNAGQIIHAVAAALRADFQRVLADVSAVVADAVAAVEGEIVGAVMRGDVE